SGPAERDLARLLAGRAESPSFVFHFRAGGAAEAGRAALEPRLEEAWKKISARFDLKGLHKPGGFVYGTGTGMNQLTGRPGRGVEDDRFTIRGVKLRALPSEPDAPIPPFTNPLRGDAAKDWKPDVEGRWKVADEEVEGVRYGRMSRFRFGGQTFKEVEVECD